MGSWGRINLVLERVLSFVEYADLLKWHPNAYLPQIVIRISNGWTQIQTRLVELQLLILHDSSSDSPVKWFCDWKWFSIINF
jgi:hypothetical protein